MHVAGVNADPRDVRAHRPRARSATRREILISELSRQGHGAQPRAARRAPTLDDAGAARVAERVKALEHAGLPLRGRRRLLRPADPQGDGRVRAALPPRVLARDRREARGRHASPPRRRSRSGSTASATCAPPRATARCTRSTARCARAIGERHPHLRDIRLVNYKVRILDEWKATGATTRVLLDASDGHDTWGAIGVHENVIEASLGRAGGLARGGHAAGPRAHSRDAAD